MLVCRRKYEAVVGDEKIARERFVKWKARCAVIGCPEVRGIDIMWSTFAPTIGMTAGRAVISLVLIMSSTFDSMIWGERIWEPSSIGRCT